jgi:hypothetical protein
MLANVYVKRRKRAEKKGKKKKKRARDKIIEKRFVAGQHKSIIMQLHRRFHTL